MSGDPTRLCRCRHLLSAHDEESGCVVRDEQSNLLYCDCPRFVPALPKLPAPELAPEWRQLTPDLVNRPPHYTWLPGVEVIDITEHLGFCLGNVIKYVLRADAKGDPLTDLRKARWYLDREIQRRERASGLPPRDADGREGAAR